MNKIYDVIVVGAGPSGLCAAISAARLGSSVLLVEKNSYPGGMNTAAMVGPLMTFHCGEKQIIKGIPEEIVQNLRKHDGTLGHVKDPIGVCSTITPVDSEMLKLVYFEMLAGEKNIRFMPNTFLLGTSVENGQIQSIDVVSKNGRQTFQGRVFIDSTGDGDLAAAAGCEYVTGRLKDGLSQPMTLMFKVDNVDLSAVCSYVKANPEQFIWDPACDLDSYIAVSGFFSQVEKARENGDFSVPRDRVLFFQGVRKGEITVNMTRVVEKSGVKTEDLCSAMLDAVGQVNQIMRFMKKYLPGFEKARLVSIADSIGVRESRKIVGRGTLTSADVIENRTHEDSIALCSYPIDIHDPLGADLQWIRKERECCYEIPFSCLIPKSIGNLAVTGRCISATHEALASARITPTAMATGEAAGVAAHISIRDKCSLPEVDVAKVQKQLARQGALPSKKFIE